MTMMRPIHAFGWSSPIYVIDWMRLDRTQTGHATARDLDGTRAAKVLRRKTS